MHKYLVKGANEISDGPDEVHLLQLGRNENKRGDAVREKLEKQRQRSEQLLQKYGIEKRDILYLGRSTGDGKSRL
jgi:acyl-CoA dehydrogenase